MDHHLTADLNVLSTLIVHLKLHVSTENVKTPALASVEEMHTAESEIMCQFVPVIKASLETHSQVATDHQQPHQDQKSLIPVDQVLVASMLSAEKEMVLLLVYAFLVSMEIPTLNASQNAQLTQNAPQTKPVSIKNVSTLVQEFVEPMLHVQSRITIHHAHVTLAILETHSDTAQELQLYLFQQKLSIHAFHLPVDQMQFVMKETEQPLVNVFQTTLEIHMLPADQSVLSTQIVHQAKHVNNFTALTHVQEHVE